MDRRTCKVSCSVGDSLFSSLPNSEPNRVFVFPLVAFFLLWPCGRLMNARLLERPLPGKKIDVGEKFHSSY